MPVINIFGGKIRNRSIDYRGLLKSIGMG